MKKLNELQENSEGQFSEIRKTTHEQNEEINKWIEIMKQKQTEILELKNSVRKMENAIEHQQQSRPNGR